MFADASKWEGEFEDLDEEHLQALIEETSKVVEEFEFENYMLDRYKKRLSIETEDSDDRSGGSRSSRSRSRRKTGGIERTMRLSAEQKCTIAKAEIESLGQEITAFRKNAESILDDHQALSDEADLEIKQIDQFKFNYNKSVAKQPFQTQNVPIAAEKDTLVDKFRLNNSTLRSQRKKLLSEQRQKEEMGEVLHEVDFEQLKIENTQFLEIIDGKNRELVRLKSTAGRVTQKLNSLKRKLTQLSQDSAEIQTENKNREEQVTKTNIEIVQVTKEKQKIEVQIERLKKLLSDYRAPSVMDYIDSVREMRLLKRREKIQNRKYALAKSNLERHRRLWQHLQKTTALNP
ncbi:hypothetical protein Aperf_G00000049450 [Anoplocephala perfoliata]